MGFHGQFEDEEALYEKDISMETEGLGTDQYDSEDSLDVFIDPATERDLVRLHRLLSWVWWTHIPFTICLGTIHATFPLTCIV